MTENKTGGLDFAAMLRGVSEPGTADQITLLPLDALHPDPENFYSLEGLDRLAENIETVGLMDPIRVRPDGESYVIVSGHRRTAAIRMIRDGGSDQFKDGVPCIVEFGGGSEAMRKLRLIFANSSTRQLTSAELSRQAEEVTRLLYELKEQGWNPPGRMRDHVAEACNVSKTKIGRLHAIRENLKPELLNLYDKGTINESAAYELQKLPMDVQRYLAGQKKIAQGVSGEAARLCAERSETYLHPTCKCPDGSACSHTLPRFYQTATTRWSACRGGCCLECRYTESDCPYQCRLSKKHTEERRAKDRSDREKAEEARQKRQDKTRAVLAGKYMALAVLCKDRGLTSRDVINIPGAQTVGDLEAKAADPSKISAYAADEEEVFSKYSFIRDLRNFADKVDVSTDFLLGRTDVPEINRGEETDCHTNAAALVRNDSAEDDLDAGKFLAVWFPGEPTIGGRYLCLLRGVADGPEDSPKEFTIDLTADGPYFFGRPMLDSFKIVGYWPLPPKMEEQT